MMAINTIATHPRDDSVEIFRNSVALVWPLWGPDGLLNGKSPVKAQRRPVPGHRPHEPLPAADLRRSRFSRLSSSLFWLVSRQIDAEQVAGRSPVTVLLVIASPTAGNREPFGETG
jgi:hypothetical protein